MNEDERKRFNHFLRRGSAYLREGKPDEALRLLKKAHKMDPDDFDVSLNLSGAYILTKQFKEAVPILEQLSEEHPENVMVWTNLGAAYLGNPILAQDEQQQLAITAFTKAYELNPATPNVAYNLGLVYRDRKEVDTAVTWFKRALQANPNDRDARHLIEQLENKQQAS